MENRQINLITIGLEREGIVAKIKIPRFAEEDTCECKKDMEELEEIVNELGNKVCSMLDKYNPKNKAPKDLDKAFIQVLAALHAALGGDEE